MSSVRALHHHSKPLLARCSAAKRLVLSLGLLALAVIAPAAGANTLEDISFSTLPGDRLELTFQFSEPASEPLSFTIDDPARIALDFENTDSALRERTTPIGIGATRSVTAVEANGRTRVVINLSELVSYQTRVDNNRVIVALGAAGSDVAFDTPAQAAPATAQTPAPLARQQRRIEGVDFRRGANGEARIMIDLSDPQTPIDLRDQQGEVILDIIGASLPDELERRLDVSDFATPAQTIDVFETDGDTRVVIKAAGDYDQIAYQSNDIFTVEIKEFQEQLVEAEARDKVWEGEKLSLNFQDIEVRSVLQLIADFTGLNVVVSDSVQGNLTLRLKNVPWDQALDIILKTKGLAMRQNGNVLLIAPAEEIAAREKQELEDQQSIEKLLPLRTELMQINYAKAEDIAGLLIASKALEGAEGAEGDNALATVLSSRGSVMVDQRTNTLLVRDTEPSLVAVRRLISKLDIPVRQVLIESRVVIATDDFSKELGVRFGVNGQERITSNGDVGRAYTSGSLDGTTQQINGDDLELADRLNVDLPVSNPAGSFGLALAKLPLGLLLELELSAAQAESKAEVVSSPRVITSNQKQAVIRQGVEIPYLEATSSGATNVSFKEAVLKLEVTPSITPDDRVNMDLAVHKDNVGELFAGIPSIDTRSVETLVLVDNGQTVVLGGIYETETSRDVRRVPFFSDIPLVGSLFRTTTDISDKSELLIFVTPKIISENLRLVN